MKKPKKLGARARRAMILELADSRFSDSDGVEVDSNAKLSEGDDNGTYVAAWVWVDFSGTALCKGEGSSNGEGGSHENCEEGCPVFDAEVAAAT